MTSDRYIQGTAELDAQLALLEKAYSGSVLSDSLFDAATTMQDTLVNAAPVDTGTLRDSIRIVRVDVRTANAQVDIIVDKDAWYWRFSEFGTVHEPARAWARRAIRRVRAKVNAQIQQQSVAQIERIAR